jgi:spore germination protein YaaH
VAGLAIVGGVLLIGLPRSIGPVRLGDATRSSAAAPSDAIATAAPPIPGHEVYGFVPYWEIDDTIAAHLRATNATTVALFSVTHASNGEIATSLNGYRAISGPVGRQIVADAHELGRRVDVTWTSFGRAKNEALFASDALQERVIASLVALRADLEVDGIAVDVEEIDPTDIPAYGAFVGRLQAALRAADPASTITAATGPGPQGAALAVAATLAGADRIFLMGYDYRTASSEPGASAPMTRRDGLERSLGWSVDLYAAAGIPAERMLLGLPLYGMAWPTAAADLGSPRTGSGDIWVPRRNLATLQDPTVAESYDPIEDVAFLAVRNGKAWQAVYYDTPRSLRPKLALANELGLAGAGFWALGYERGLPDYTDLIADFRAGRSMTDAAVVP